MNPDLNLHLILLAALIASLSPGPATLAIAGTAMNSGRKRGLVLASGITSGSLIWAVSAALGLAALMLANAWTFEIMRYVGACYLIYLAYKSARAALSKGETKVRDIQGNNLKTVYAKGLALHLTNPKAILFFGSLFSIGMPANAQWQDVAIVIMAVGCQSFIIFHLYAVLFSSRPVVSFYTRSRRWLEGLFAIAFGFAGLKILTTRLG